MPQQSDEKRPTETRVTTEDVKRVLEVGRLLFSVLSEEELDSLREFLYESSPLIDIGNAGDS